ncbi:MULTISPECIES: hypothetical protein [unclassified Streptomyces]|uniref:hypothetical protein n=1 Tax=unclassified Streptomyces TaxID=2593676 RepID=UPI0022B65AAF|nr:MULTISPECIES: hypothetical protein [unclassified Streptomyces]MCZ7416993.1 hypothetical protein [Streptomyces sp. WMMC897]MCZ7433179.1 hypothetical protein [Streptomyces sp. WMMC1477]
MSVGVAALLAVAGGAVWLLDADEDEAPEPPATVAVIYTVTGEGPADISYHAGDGGAAKTAAATELPWTAEVEVTPDGGPATVTVVLGEEGGEAQCTVAVRGEHRQRSTAFGTFGRATCSAEVAR